MKNKIIFITSMTILAFAILFLGIKYSITNNFSKLKADISYPTSTGVKVICDDIGIDVNGTTTCTLTGYLSGGVRGVTGKVVSANGIEITGLTPATGMSRIAGSGNSFVIGPESGDVTSDQFAIATFTVKGLAAGTGSIIFTGDEEENVELTNADFNSVYVDDASLDITIQGTTPEPTPSSDNTLKSLKMNNQEVLGDLIQTVPYTTSSINITATANDTTARVSGDIGTKSLNVGINSFEIVVTAEDGSIRTYTLDVTRENETQKSSVNTLSALTVSNATITPEFESSVTNYSSVVSNTITSVTIAATPTDSKATVSGDLGEKTLQVGKNTFNILVTAEDGTSKKTYEIEINREDAIEPSKSSDNTLKSLAVSNAILKPEFSKTTAEYTATVNDNIDEVTIIATASDSKAKIEGTGTKQITDGSNAFIIVVTAENNSKKIYTITVVKTKPTCSLQLVSDIYKVDNEKLTINNVSRDHSLEVIKGNLHSDCGVISVSENRVVLSLDSQVKEYTINRVWMPQTGQKVIKYIAIIAVLLGSIVALIYVNKKMNK